MKKNRNQDWTDVLRERLQDARLPLEDKWGSSAAAPGRAAGPSFADTHRSAWWPWALAGVAALVAAVLLLRPASAPEPDRLVQQPVSTALPDTSSSADVPSPSFAGLTGEPPDAGQAEPIVLLPQPDRSRLTRGLPSGQQLSQRTRPTAPDSTGKRAQAPADSTLRLPLTPATSSFAGLPSSSFAGLTGESPTGREEIPDRVGDDSEKKVGDDGRKTAEDERHEPVRPLSELALADLPDEPAQPRRNRLGRVALRVQAGYEGASISGGTFTTRGSGRCSGGYSDSASPSTNPSNAWEAENYFYVPVLRVNQQPGVWRVIEFPSSADPGLPDGSSDAGHTPEGQLVTEYVPGERLFQKVPVAVPKAPVFPISFGVSASWSLSRSWTLSVGLDYAQHDGYQAVALPIESQKHYNTSPGGTGYMAYLETAQSLTLHYLGVPLDVHFYFNPESRWRFYVGAGLHAAKCIAVTGGMPLQDPVLFSGNLMAGADFRLFPGVRLYLAPAVAAPFNRSAYYNSWDTGLHFSLRAGLSFDL